MKQKSLGIFKTEIEAFLAYKEAKESYIKDVTKTYKNQISEKAYYALMSYSVDISD